MIVHQIPVGQMQNFTYVVYDEATRECIIIDPSWDLEKIMDVIKNKSLKPIYIVNTHHFDHTGNTCLYSNPTRPSVYTCCLIDCPIKVIKSAFGILRIIGFVRF